MRFCQEWRIAVILSEHHSHNRRWPEFERLCEAAEAKHLAVRLTVEDGRLSAVLLTRANQPIARRMMRIRVDDPWCSADLDATAKALRSLIPR
jgi:hypothetical protein